MCICHTLICQSGHMQCTVNLVGFFVQELAVASQHGPCRLTFLTTVIGDLACKRILQLVFQHVSICIDMYG